ncbi:hypothetical protein C5B91_17170 [Haloferax sp. Atlit-10N]|uniref:hypothetical protein n=1 Tax=Haloferax TaxID=2251 RepID=UPI000679BF06|nr:MULTISPECIES: hypothetical protein [Haloferax]RDZ39945.1 hypothetical protein C5B87_18795 [Haloferax sp. Atlit-16N]RDZ56529.1 hypothetical protein C5B91_17170 [Haloferax sp. Atlit-10N]
MSESADGTVGVHRALVAAVRTVFHHPVQMVAISVGWVLASIPLVTLGPATLGVYSAVASVREQGHIDRDAVRATLSNYWLDALLFSGLMVAFPALAVFYLGRFAASGSALAGVLGMVGFYLAYHAWVVFALAFVALAQGDDAFDAVTDGYRWSVERPVATVLVGVVTATLLVVCSVLTVALPLVFPALVAAFHTELAAQTRAQKEDAADAADSTAPTDRPVSGESLRNDFSATFRR